MIAYADTVEVAVLVEFDANESELNEAMVVRFGCDGADNRWRFNSVRSRVNSITRFWWSSSCSCCNAQQ